MKMTTTTTMMMIMMMIRFIRIISNNRPDIKHAQGPKLTF